MPLQHADDTPRDVRAAMSPTMQAALRSPGQALDASMRAYMEPRFGNDFSKVRLHVDAAAQASAAAEGAMAYSTGHDVVFGAGQYQPDTIPGRWLLAHELAHVVQQREGSVSESGSGAGALESEAEQTGMRVALGGNAQVSTARGGPSVQFLKVSSGGFGKALEDFTSTHAVEDSAVGLLVKSRSFNALASILDKHYVWSLDPAFMVTRTLKTSSPAKTYHDLMLKVGPDGVVTSPSVAAGKRSLTVTMGGGSRFEPYGSASSYPGSDRIILDAPDTPTFIQNIAHEATHAAAFVGAPAPAGQTLAQEIDAGIKDEIHARQSEATILGEVGKYDRAVQAKVSTVGTTDPWKVQRDFSPGLGTTYLESFFFARELQDAQATEKLDDASAQKIREELDLLVGSRVAKPRSDYGQIWFNWKTAEYYWKLFNQAHDPADPDFEAEKEKELQLHAKWYFKNKVTYLPKP
ncbi:hypothetical protein B0E51_12565 [Rhodanobacter sp. C05]|nr:hypothetical protein B0E51_12565 [Rhodanobacter sp. C05]